VLEWSKKNREVVTEVVQREVRKQMTRLGAATKEEISSLRKRVRDLEAAERPGKASAAKESTKRAAAKKPAAKKTTVKKATSTRATGRKKTPATKTATRKAGAKKATVRKSAGPA
jgi:hypothetical protein